MRKKSANARHIVAVVLTNDFSPFEFAVACEVFGIDRSADVGLPWYRLLVCAGEPPPIRSRMGFILDTPLGLDGLRRADTIVVPASNRHEPPGELVDALRKAHARGARIISVCSGAFALAAAGLLDGRPATTHWMYVEEFGRKYPKVRLDPDVLYVDDGDILTSAGTAAGIDLCLHVVRLDYGAEAANIVARRMLVPPHRDGGQAQYIREPMPALRECDPFAEVLVWAQEHLDEDVSVEDLARRSAMSPRTFARRFRDTTGATPHRWLVQQRVLLAQRLLETTDLPIDAIASRTGLGTATNLRQHFQRVVRTSPQAYRRTFQQAAAS